MAKTGFPFYRAETDRFQDIKIKRLKKRYHATGYAVYQFILNEIYRVEGCYLEFGEDEAFDVAEYWGIEEAEVMAITTFCCEIGLFDEAVYDAYGILSARSIQIRYIDMCKLSKRKAIIPEQCKLLSKEEIPVPPTQLPEQNAPTPPTPDAQNVPSPQPSPEIELSEFPENLPETPENSRKNEIFLEKTGKTPEKFDRVEKSRKEENTPSSIPPPEEEEDKASPLPDENSGNNPVESSEALSVPPDDYYRKLKAFGEACCSMGCAQSDLRDILLIENIAQDDSPIWGFMEEARHSGGRQTFYNYVIPSLRSLIAAGRLQVMKPQPEAAAGEKDVKQMLTAIGVPSYEADALYEEAAGMESVLLELIAEIRKSKGKILMPAYFIRSRLEKAKKNEIQKTA